MSSEFDFKTDGRELAELLDHWFENGYTRNCSLPFNSELTSLRIARVAASLFKRGAPSLTDTCTGKHYPLTELTPSKHAQHETPIFFHDTMSQFFTESHLFSHNGDSFFICDSSVLSAHPTLQSRLRQFVPNLFEFTPTEHNKSLQTLVNIIRSVKTQPKRVIVIGGGICCDIGGLAGSLMNAQVHLVPTTLLSAADAGVGGKTGVNHPKAGKNQIGRFISLASVSVITELFQSLSASQLRQGVAEIAKHSYLAGKFKDWQDVLTALIQLDDPISIHPPILSELLKQNIAFKSSVVALDPFDQNIRCMLNFGHTTAHLIEASQARSDTTCEASHKAPAISHGIAVAIGMFALSAARLIPSYPKEFFQFLGKLLQAEKITFPLNLNTVRDASVHDLLQQDKKKIDKKNDAVRLVVPNYGALQHPELIVDRLQFMTDNILEIDSDEFIALLIKSGVFA